jgi:putative OPT family oligopeptide transporter
MTDVVDIDIPQANASPRKELTFRVVVLGLLLAVVMGAANVYVGLRAGMTVSASIPAAVMAMLLFKMLFKDSTILEANQVQTCASAGESLAAGIIFTMPAMILIGFWDSFDFWSVTIIALTGGLLGILFMIPMRKVLILNNDELAYPEGVACAAVLKAGEDQGNEGAGRNLLFGGLLGATVAISAKLFGLISGTLEAASVVGSRIFYFGGDLSPMLIAIGFIVRLNVAILIFIGGAISWLIGIPLLGGADQFPVALDGAYELWSTKIRYVGVGAMVVGGFSSLYSVRHGLVAAVKELRNNLTSGKLLEHDLQRDISTSTIMGLGIACIVVLAFVNYRFTGGIGITLLSTLVMVVMGFFFTAVASYIVGLVGNSNSPVSGMTITAVLVAGGMLWLFNYSGMEAMVATLGIAAIVC